MTTNLETLAQKEKQYQRLKDHHRFFSRWYNDLCYFGYDLVSWNEGDLYDIVENLSDLIEPKISKLDHQIDILACEIRKLRQEMD